MRNVIVFTIFLLLASPVFSQNSRNVSLDGQWNLYYAPYSEDGPLTPAELNNSNWPVLPAKVPGNVELDLLSAGIIKNPETGNQIYDLRKYEAFQWWYSRTFKSPKINKGERVELVFGGLDCFGTIWVNGKLAGESDNMLIEQRFDVTGLLVPEGENTLYVRINPAVREAQKYINSAVGSRKFLRVEQEHIRKAPHMYGWDILPRLVSAGLWRSVSLEIKKTTRFEQAYWMTNSVDVEKKTAEMLLDWQFSTNYPTIDGLTMEVSLERLGKTVYKNSFPLYSHSSRQRIQLDNVDFWWPCGYGEPALYNATLRITDTNRKILDEVSQKVGIRTADLIRTEVTTPENPGEFVFKINGEKIFVRGTNWVPLDAFHSRDKQHLESALAMITDLNCNMIRCWGGNVYEDHDFFNWCDQNGIMVWQDFSLAGTAYPQDYEFAEKIRKEAVSVVLKLRKHPSIVLWCGNNEVDIALAWNFKKPVDPGMDIISREVLPRVIWEFDPIRDYLPSSPFAGNEYFKQGNNMAIMPQVHLWGLRGDYKTPFYTQSNAHFVSEIGYHGCPNRSSLERMFSPESVYPWTEGWNWNDEWQTKAVRAHPEFTLANDRNDLMINQEKILFGECPRDLDQFIFGSQVVQAEAMKYFVELWRMSKFSKTGIIWWNLRDGWPIISDAVVDYYNSKKLAYYYIRQVQHDACVMIGDPKDGNHPVIAVNDTREEKSGKVTIKDADSGETIFSSAFTIPVNGKTWMGNIPETGKQSMWLIEYTIDNEKFTNHYLAGKAPFKLEEYQRWFQKLKIERN